MRDRFGLLGVQPGKTGRLIDKADGAGLVLLSGERLDIELSLDQPATSDLKQMGPSAFHTTPDEGDTGAAGNVSAEFELFVFDSSGLQSPPNRR
jgi:hypothetical protein